MKKILNIFAKMILPSRCLLCGAIVDENGAFCSRCFNQIDFIEKPYCKKCGIPFEFENEPEMTCARCLAYPPHFDSAVSVFAYENKGRDIVLAFKYADRTDTAKPLAKLMVRAGKSFFESFIDTLIPVPIHKSKLIARRYNQAALLVREISKSTKIKAEYDILIKKEKSKPQAECSFKERAKNIKNTFIIENQEKIKGKNIILVDDVLTTGSTANECAKILKKHGAKTVKVLTLARTKLGE